MSNLVHASIRNMGRFTIHPLALGCWRLVGMPAAQAQACYEAALDADMNLVDTADVYGFDWGGYGFGDAEQLLGQVLRSAPGLRERMVLASKGGIVPGVPYDTAALRGACEASLQRLGVEQIYLYQIHRPDLLTHPQETA
ncbi:MAG: aldo/keto reductase, partial [Pseudomonadota bacterium]